MDLKDKITELKEKVFLKKQTGQPYKNDEKRIRSMEDQLRAEEKEEKARETAIADLEKRIEKETATAAAVAPEEPAHQESQKEIVQKSPPEDMPQDK